MDTNEGKAMNITQARKKILDMLVESDGTIMGARLGGVGRVSASKMQALGLVRWESPQPSDPNRDDLSAWKLHITDAGRAALSES